MHCFCLFFLVFLFLNFCDGVGVAINHAPKYPRLAINKI
jgi:hypothetical protein